MEVKQINKRASGQAFELILKPPSPVSEAPRTLASPKKKDVSLDEIQKKLEAAEERRKVCSHCSRFVEEQHFNITTSLTAVLLLKITTFHLRCLRCMYDTD